MKLPPDKSPASEAGKAAAERFMDAMLRGDTEVATAAMREMVAAAEAYQEECDEVFADVGLKFTDGTEATYQPQAKKNRKKPPGSSTA